MRNKQLVIGMAVLTVLLAGCAQGTKAESTVVPVSSTNAGGIAANGANPDGKTSGSMFSEAERQMVSTFQALLAMDNQEGLSITKAQAEKMFPQVEKSVKAGELTAVDKKSLESLLTAEQTTFYSKFASGGGQRGGMGERPSEPRLQPGGNPSQGGNFQRPNVESQLVELLKSKLNA